MVYRVQQHDAHIHANLLACFLAYLPCYKLANKLLRIVFGTWLGVLQSSSPMMKDPRFGAWLLIQVLELVTLTLWQFCILSSGKCKVPKVMSLIVFVEGAILI